MFNKLLRLIALPDARRLYRTARQLRLRCRWTSKLLIADLATSTSNLLFAIETTWRWLCVKYFVECGDYKRPDPRTQHVRRLILENTFAHGAGFENKFRDWCDQ